MKFNKLIEIIDTLGYSATFESSAQLQGFLEEQIEFWKKAEKHSQVAHNAFSSHHQLYDLYTRIDSALKTPSVKNKEDLIQSAISESNFKDMGFINSHSLVAQQVIQLASSDSNQKDMIQKDIVNQFIATLKDPSKYDTKYKEEALGSLLAVNVLFNQFHPNWEPDTKKASFKTLITAFEESIKKNYTRTEEQTARFDKVIRNYDELSSQAHEFHNAKLDQENTKIETLFSSWKSKIHSLEETYEKKLKLQKPAEYWQKSAAKHQKHVTLAASLLAIVTIISTAFIGSFFNSWIKQTPMPLDIGSFQGAILFGVLIAIIAFILKMLSRIIFSSLHLARDAEEREQLTYFYLALEHEDKLPNNERELILNALFSRSETGLLINEHGPTLPISDLVRATKGPSTG